MVIFLVQQSVAQPQFMENGFVGIAFAVLFKDGFADHFSGHLLLARQIIRVRQATIVIDRRIDGQALLTPQIIVVEAVAGSDMDEAGAGVARNKIGGKCFASAITKRMPVFKQSQIALVQIAYYLIIGPSKFLSKIRKQRSEGNETFRPDFNLRISKFWVVSDCKICRQCPRRGGPNSDGGHALTDRKFYEHALADVVVVFASASARGGAGQDAPIHRLFARYTKPFSTMSANRRSSSASYSLFSVR